jgi:hypothetical protein
MPYITYNESGTNKKFVKDNTKYVTGDWPSGSITMTYSAVSGEYLMLDLYKVKEEGDDDVIVIDWGDGSPKETYIILNYPTHTYFITTIVTVTITGIQNTDCLGVYTSSINSSILSMSISESCTSIDTVAAMRQPLLSSVDIPASLSNLLGLYFLGCTSLVSINLSQYFTKLDTVSLVSSPITSITIYPSWNNFRVLDLSNVDITSLIIPSGLPAIEHLVCERCKSLAYVSLPTDFPAIDGCIIDFSGCNIATEENIEHILTQLNNSGTSYGTIDIRNEFTGVNAPVNATAYAAGESLKTKGWTVYYSTIAP